MKRLSVLWLLLMLSVTACQPIRPVAELQVAALSAEDQFVKVALAFEDAYQQEDLEQTIAFYAEDASSSPPGFPTSRGKDAIRADYQAFFEAYDIQRDFTLAGVAMNGDSAVRFGEWTQILTPTDGGEAITEVGRCVVGFEKIDGEWKVVWETWNTYDPQ